MADQFLAEIRVLPFTFAPKGWAWCNGQLMPISQNTALFALLGTTYGGDGKSTFALPNLQGSVPMHVNGNTAVNGAYSEQWLGQQGGTDTVTLLQSEMPVHNHGWRASGADSVSNDPNGQLFAGGVGIDLWALASQPATSMSPNTITPQGGSQPHNNLQPYLTLNFNIALQGIFPARS